MESEHSSLSGSLHSYHSLKKNSMSDDTTSSHKTSQDLKEIVIGKSAWFQKTIHLRPVHRGCHLVTDEILKKLSEMNKFIMGLCHIQILHTSASLALNENWDPDVRDDMEMFLTRLIPEVKLLIYVCILF